MNKREENDGARVIVCVCVCLCLSKKQCLYHQIFCNTAFSMTFLQLATRAFTMVTEARMYRAGTRPSFQSLSSLFFSPSSQCYHAHIETSLQPPLHSSFYSLLDSFSFCIASNSLLLASFCLPSLHIYMTLFK